MDAPSPAIVLLLAARPETAGNWAEMLDDRQFDVRRRRPGPGESRVDVIVTDRAEIAGRRGGDPAVVRIGGGDGPADVRLPADCTPRELLMACELLAEIVRLRRRGRRAAHIRQELSAQALSDPLTALPNRRAWDLALKERTAAAAEAPNQLCLAILDLDHFKQINDLHGHAVGDEVLRASGRTISDHLRQDDFVARFGGDEFGLLLWVPDDATAAAILRRVRTALPGEHARAGLPTRTASVGYRLAGRGAQSAPLPCPEALYQAAAAALREAKQQGRDRTVGHGGDDCLR
ncbi:MAG: GGDEF domain-containing protein [Thermoguttaceae bacterium]